jgi:hypothetical protein
VGDKRHGPAAGWYADGSTRLQGTYRSGRKHGLFVTWHANGVKRSEENFVRGREVGRFARWDKAGQVVFDTVLAGGADSMQEASDPQERAAESDPGGSTEPGQTGGSNTNETPPQ